MGMEAVYRGSMAISITAVCGVLRCRVTCGIISMTGHFKMVVSEKQI